MSSDEVELEPAEAAKIGPSRAVAPATGPQAPTAVDPSSIAEISQALASGDIDAIAAQELLIDQITRQQLPPGASAEQITRLRETVSSLLAGDPTLAGLLETAPF